MEPLLNLGVSFVNYPNTTVPVAQSGWASLTESNDSDFLIPNGK